MDRLAHKQGFCGTDASIRVARAALHFWEEPPISGTQGSGAIFFAGCALRCIYCQNDAISRGEFGQVISDKRLVKIMLELQDQGANNINLVTPTHFASEILTCAKEAKRQGLAIPIVCNTSGYELASTVEALGEVVDIWLTDFKYSDSELAGRLSFAKDYPEMAACALQEMIELNRAQGGRILDDRGMMKKGIIVRHLVLPGQVENSLGVLDRIYELSGPDGVDVSIMNQYTPNKQVRAKGGRMAGPVFDSEYDKVMNYAEDLAFSHIWWQDGQTVSESFIPAFDSTGVEGPE